jgi:ribosomal-protein-alanine N-acetyltransferase
MVDPEEVLVTGRLLLEPLTAAHATALFPIVRDPALYEFVPAEPPPHEADLRQRLAWLARRSSPDGKQIWLNWAQRLRLAPEPTYVGTVQATVCGDATALLAYELGTAFRGHGYATESCARVIELLFDGYSVTRVLADVDTRNRASIRLLERLGFTRGRFTPRADFFKGLPSDEHRYELSSPPVAGA